MSTNTLKQKIKYKFDNFLSRGSFFILMGLALASLVSIGLLAILSLLLKTDSSKNVFELAWMILMSTFQSGSVAFLPEQGKEESAAFIVPLLLITFLGFLVVSILIGTIVNGIQSKVDSLRKGRSLVVEHNHTIILGWSEQVYTIISELITSAKEKKQKSCIVIMGEKDKVEMEDAIRDKIDDFGKTKVVCRQGNPIEINDLEIVNPGNSKSIIVVSPENCEDPDSYVIKIILALTKKQDREGVNYNIVAEIRDAQNAEIAKIAGREEVEVVAIGDLISRILAQTCRQHGLSIVYTELLDFGGVEIYFKNEPSLVGHSFGEIIYMFELSIIIGIFDNKNKISTLNPPLDTVLKEDMWIVAISDSESSINISGMDETEYAIDNQLISTSQEANLEPEKTLILGWNWRVPSIIIELDYYVPEGSLLMLVSGNSEGEQIVNEKCEKAIKNQTIKYLYADTANRRVLDELMKEGFEHVIIVCYDHLSPQQADAKTMVTLLHLRDIKEKTGKHFSIVSEMLDIKNKNLAEAAKVNDFIISDKLISLLLSQLSENKLLNSVFSDLFNPIGLEIYLKPASDYIKLGQEVNFFTITKAAIEKGDIAIGYKLDSLSDEFLEDNPDKGHGVIICPEKSKKVKFGEDDKIIVLSEHQLG